MRRRANGRSDTRRSDRIAAVFYEEGRTGNDRALAQPRRSREWTQVCSNWRTHCWRAPTVPAVDLLVANEGPGHGALSRPQPPEAVAEGPVFTRDHHPATLGQPTATLECVQREGCPRETRQSALGWWVRKMSTPWVILVSVKGTIQKSNRSIWLARRSSTFGNPAKGKYGRIRKSQLLQCAMAERVRALGWQQVEIINSDLGSSASLAARPAGRL
jgi:hypothetical protein